jgi:hypothetical protein
MRLTTEDGGDLVEPSASQLDVALSRLGQPGNGFAILGKTEQCYIQTSGSRADGYTIEYRNGNDREHYSSVRSDIPHIEMVAAFQAYRVGGNWRSLIEWSNGQFKKRHRSSARKRDSIAERWLLALFFAIGTISISIGIYRAFNTQQFLRRAIEVPGTVVRMVQRGDTYAPIVEYKDREGHVRTLHTSQSSSPPSFFAGEGVVVVYDPSDANFPLNAKIRSFGELWGGVLFASAFGCFFVGIPSAIWVILRRQRDAARVA